MESHSAPAARDEIARRRTQEVTFSIAKSKSNVRLVLIGERERWNGEIKRLIDGRWHILANLGAVGEFNLEGKAAITVCKNTPGNYQLLIGRNLTANCNMKYSFIPT